MRERGAAARPDLERPAADADLATLTNDSDDRFVCALALSGRATYLLTFDEGYAADALAEHGVTVMSPDAWLEAALDDEPELFPDLLEAQARAWGGQSVGELLDALDRAGGSTSCARRAR